MKTTRTNQTNATMTAKYLTTKNRAGRRPIEALGWKRRKKLLALAQRQPDARLDHLLPLFLKAQRRTERRHYLQRVDLMVYERERQEILKNIGADPYVD